MPRNALHACCFTDVRQCCCVSCCTGIGPEASALCVTYVISDCAEAVKELIYSGTAGWSAQASYPYSSGKHACYSVAERHEPAVCRWEVP